MTSEEPTPRWLDADEEQAWIGTTVLMWQLTGPLDAQLQRESGLSLFEYFVLARLSMVDGRRLRMSELADGANARPSRLSNAVGRLESRGWVTRETDTADRRGTVAILTEAGLATVVGAAPGHVEAVRRLVVDRLTPDQLLALAAIGTSIRAAVAAERCCPPVGESDC